MIPEWCLPKEDGLILVQLWMIWNDTRKWDWCNKWSFLRGKMATCNFPRRTSQIPEAKDHFGHETRCYKEQIMPAMMRQNERDHKEASTILNQTILNHHSLLLNHLEASHWPGGVLPHKKDWVISNILCQATRWSCAILMDERFSAIP